MIHVGLHAAIETATIVAGSATGTSFIFAVIAPTDAIGD
jgi:hypothetical protein